jgi:hypothetical protein
MSSWVGRPIPALTLKIRRVGQMPEAPIEAKIQSMVQNVDVGIGALILRRVSLFVMIGLVCLYYPATQFRGLSNDEAMDNMQLGRNLALGRGYVTDVIRPLQVAFMEDVTRQRLVPLPEMPEVFRAPFYPAVLSLLFRGAAAVQTPQELFFPISEKVPQTFPAERQWLVPFLELLFVLSIIMTYRMGKLLFDDRVAFTALWLFFLCDDLWKSVLTGRPFVLVLFLVTFSLYTLLKATLRHESGVNRVSTWVFLALSGLSIALTGMTYYSLILLWLPWLIVVGRTMRPFAGRAVLLGIVIFAMVSVPVMMFNIRMLGVPYGMFGLAPLSLVAETRLMPLRLLQESLDPEFSQLGFGAFMLKLISNLREVFVVQAKSIGDGWMIGIFVAILPFRFRRPEVNRFRWLAFWMIGATLFGAAAVGLEGHFLLGKALYPLVLLYGVGFFYLMLDRLDIRVRLLRRLVILAFVLLNISGFLLTFFGPRTPDQFPPYNPKHIVMGMSDPVMEDARNRAAELENSDGRVLVSSDIPEAVAWYGGERTLMLPASMDDFTSFSDFYHTVSAMYVSTRMRNLKPLDDLTLGPYGDWAQLALGQVMNPARFPPDLHLRYVGYPIGGESVWTYFLYDRPVMRQIGQ